jgi:hydroxymethylpyrimidine kinase/phosphomethylpyrimidine kinase/thiamine-phosphate diphosphorylase
VSKFGLIIAGSDSSGAAGVQADLRAFQAYGVHAAAAITAVTSQGANGVSGVQLVEADVLASQIEDAFNSYDISSVKVGMLGSSEQVRAVTSALKRHRPQHVVLDPVLASTSGTPLLDEEGIAALGELISLSTLITPNLDELSRLTGMPLETPAQRIKAASKLIESGAKAVLVKGGHLDGAPVDVLVQAGQESHDYEDDRVNTDHSRGTGCLLSSLIAACLALGIDLQPAVFFAKSALTEGLKNPVEPARGSGYPLLPVALSRGPARTVGSQLLQRLHGIYFLTDPDLSKGVSHHEMAAAALKGGAQILQLRDKHLPLRELIETAKNLRRLARKHRALFIVNDRVDVAIASRADGVHLGPDDMHPRDARACLGAGKLIGVSVSTVQEAKQLAPFASYLAVGAIFGSSTKSDAGPPVGTQRITEIKAAFPDKKIVAIGGINLSNSASVAAAGADAAAVVSAVICAPNPEHAIRELLAEFERGKLLAG